MPPKASFDRSRLWQFDRDELAQWQLRRLNRLLAEVLPANLFYQHKLGRDALELDSLDQLRDVPFTTKQELLGSKQDDALSSQMPTAANLTFPSCEYVRFHQTSGTQGQPLVVLDTADDWSWWIDCWQYILDAVGIGSEDRVLVASSFGPFIAWWSATDALVSRGAMPLPGGGLSSLARIDLMRRTQATALFCTPTYALRLIEIAGENDIDLRTLKVGKILVAGEPGGSIISLRERIEESFDATVFDHAGASEVGPWGIADAYRTGLHIIEPEFIAEFLSIESGQPAASGELSHLVLTTLGRAGAPVIRYDTGDLVRPEWNDDGPCKFVRLDGGVLGRNDDMMIIRGVNIFPSSIDAVLREFPEVVEYRITARRDGAMDSIEIEVEDQLKNPERISTLLTIRLGIKMSVRSVPAGSLPRFEAKGKRFVDARK